MNHCFCNLHWCGDTLSVPPERHLIDVECIQGMTHVVILTVRVVVHTAASDINAITYKSFRHH